MANYGFVGAPLGPGAMGPGSMGPGPMGPGSMGPGSMQGQMIGPQMQMMAAPPVPGGAAGMDPSTNNQPLKFNMSKGKPPMPMAMPSEGDMPQGIQDNKNKVDMDIENIDQDYRINGSMGAGGNMSGGNMGQMMGQWGPMMPGPMMGDPGMMMGPMGPSGWGPMGPGMGPMAPGGMMDPAMPRHPIQLSNDTMLYPPPPTAQPPTTRERPPGCRTIFVGGLPENITEEMIREMFDKCGTITSIRLSKKNFAHVRFEEEIAVEKSLAISGYRIKLENKDDKPNTGRLHIDYAQARDDLYEWECNQRALAREMRHRQRVEEERLRPPSPPPVIHFSDHEAQVLLERLKGDETFAKSAETLIAWMERGDCNRRTSSVFYSMVQSTNAHVRRLTSEKAQYNEEYEEMKQKFRHRLEGLLRQFGQIDKVFSAATKQKAWDHFTKAQRKNIDTWRKLCSDIHKKEEQEFLKERREDEMEMSDEESEPYPKKKKPTDNLQEVQEWRALREENTNMKFQIEAFKNEVEILKAENREQQMSVAGGSEDKEKSIKILQQTLQGMQQQLISAKKDLRDREQELMKKLDNMEYENNKLKRENQRHKANEESKGTERSTEKSDEGAQKDTETVDLTRSSPAREVPSSSSSPFSDREARLVGLISTFLHVHPFGASVDYIWSYLQRLQIKIRTSEIEDILEKCTSVFKLDVSGVGASIEKRWKFIGFNPY